MSDLGQLLQKARREKGISLEDLQEITKIRKRYLEAIEEGSYQVLPGNFYARAFIKSYSEAVGLDPDEVMRLYRNEIPALQNEPYVEPMRRQTRSPNSEKWSKWASLILVIAFPLLIVGIIYYFFFYNAEPKKAVDQAGPLTENSAPLDGTPTLPPVSTATPSPVPTPTPTLEPPKLTLTSTDESNYLEVYEVHNSTGVDVELKLSDNGVECWAGISQGDGNGKMLHQIKLEKNGTTSVHWTVDGSAFLNIGRADSVELTINGQEMEMGNIPNPKRFQLNVPKQPASPT